MMGDTLLPELGMVVSFYVLTRMLQVVLGSERQTTDRTVFALATITTVISGIAAVNMTILTLREWIARLLG